MIDSSDESNSDSDRDTSTSRSRYSGGSSPPSVTFAKSDQPARPVLSLSAAAEAERIEISSKMLDKPTTQPTRRSMLNPVQPGKAASNTQANTPSNTPRRKYVRPNTNFDGGSRASTPFSSDTEQSADAVKKAAAMQVIESPIEMFRSRAVKTIVRGNFVEAEQKAKRTRAYLCATDNSMEAVYAMEWGIGTVLRSGDTMYIVQAIEKTPDMVDEDAMLAERIEAIQDTVTTIERFLKRTRLQVQIIIEVIHHKVPKHLLTEMIDYLEPTLVILGSRGRTALKSVLLGSFSNYLVAKVLQF